MWVLAYHLAVSDDTVPLKEKALVDELANGLRTEIPISPQQLLGSPSLAAFDSRESRVAAMLEILVIAMGDNKLPSAESKFVEDLASKFGFSKDEFYSMKGWAERNTVLLDEMSQFMKKSDS